MYRNTLLLLLLLFLTPCVFVERAITHSTVLGSIPGRGKRFSYPKHPDHTAPYSLVTGELFLQGQSDYLEQRLRISKVLVPLPCWCMQEHFTAITVAISNTMRVCRETKGNQSIDIRTVRFTFFSLSTRHNITPLPFPAYNRSLTCSEVLQICCHPGELLRCSY